MAGPNVAHLTLLDTSARLAPDQARSYICLPFHVPEEMAALRLRFSFAPPAVGTIQNLLTLSLFDPHGFRGAGHRHAPAQEIVLGPLGATPGFIPGPISAGDWLVEIDCHCVLACEQGGVDYRLIVEACAGAGPGQPWTVPAAPYLAHGDAAAAGGQPGSVTAGWRAPQDRRASASADAGARWLKGDLHVHSQHSDARWTMDDLARYVERNRLDFLAVTDHNTSSATPEVQWALRRAGLDVIVIPAMELTTFYGHANALGVDHWIDWRVRGPEERDDADGPLAAGPNLTAGRSIAGRAEPGGGAAPARTMRATAEGIRRAGGAFVINHPRSAGYPFCTGCRWEFGDESATYADAIEVWNGAWDRPQNRQALALWNRWLDQGHRLPATAGSDAHTFPRRPDEQGFTFVWAVPEIAGVVAAVRAGRAYLSSGPALVWQDEAATGRLPPEASGLCLQVGRLGQEAELLLIHNGHLLAHRALSSDCLVRFELPEPPRRVGWYRADLYRPGTRKLLAMTNPIFAS